MNFPTNWRDRRTFLAPTHHPFAGYCTDTKSDMKTTFGDDLFINSIYWGPDPLRKNLADTIMKEEKMESKSGKNKLEKENEIKIEENTHMNEDSSRLSGITSFFSGVLNVITNAMFSKRKPADFNTELESEMALPSMWHGAKLSDENKILQDEISNDSSQFFASEMSDCRSAAAHCQSKLEQVRVLLGTTKPLPCSLRVRRRPKKVFVEASSVEDSFEDAFSPEDFENLANDSFIEFSSPVCYHEPVFHEVDGPKVKFEKTVAPKVTSEMPKVATEAKVATALPKVATTPPKVVTGPPKVTTKPLNLATEPPKVATKPKVATEAPKVTTELPKVTTGSPKAATKPKVATEAPKVTTEPPKVPETKETVQKVSETLKIPTNDSKTPISLSEVPKIVTDSQKLCSNNVSVSIETLKVTEDPLNCETTEIVRNVPELNSDNNKIESKKELVESCEDKITKLKLLLQERRKKPKFVVDPQPPTTLPEPEPLPSPLHKQEPSPSTLLEPEPEPLAKLPPRPKPSNKTKDKRFRNPNRCSDKRRKTRMRKIIHDDALFANELHSEDVSSVENSPSTNNMDMYIKKLHKSVPYMDNSKQTQPKPIPSKEFFDEVSGRFQSASVDSEDSFQIVFDDGPKLRRVSDCDSEDSFIIFEDSPDSCYTSNDVFGDTTDSEDYDSDSDMSDSGCGAFKLTASLSKSVSNLADDSLYVDHSEDEVDCANVRGSTVCDNLSDIDVGDACDSSNSNGVLLTERKKLLRKDQPVKRVHFSPDPPKVHVMRVWLFAAKQTRVRYWEQFVTDRERFNRRIADVDMAVSWVLKPQHRSRIMFQRFMPWWNAQKRKELAEKKEREAQEKLKEEERLRHEEIERQKLKDEVESSKEVVDGEVESGSNNKNIIGTVEVGDENNSVVEEEKKEINSNHSTDRELKENDVIIGKNLDKNQYSDEILKFNEKVLDLKPDYVSGILNT